MENLTVFALSVTHKYGTDVTVHSSREKAKKCLANYAREWWYQVSIDPCPENDDDVIQEYFDKQDEYADIIETELD